MTIKKVALRLKHERLERRRMHARKRMFGTPERPRLIVYRSNRHIYSQLRDDVSARTIAGCSTMTPALREAVAGASGKIEQARIVGEHLARLAKEKGIKVVAFDRNGRKYHGRVKALADGARAGGLEF